MGDPPLLALFVIAFFAAGLFAVEQPTRSSSVPRLVPPERLSAALALNQLNFQASSIIGPAIAGLLIATVGLVGAYLVDALTFIASHHRPPRHRADPAARPDACGPACRRSARAWPTCGRAARSSPRSSSTSSPWSSPCRRRCSRSSPSTCSRSGRSGWGCWRRRRPPARSSGAVFSGWVNRVERVGRAVVGSVVVWGTAITRVRGHGPARDAGRVRGRPAGDGGGRGGGHGLGRVPQHDRPARDARPAARPRHVDPLARGHAPGRASATSSRRCWRPSSGRGWRSWPAGCCAWAGSSRWVGGCRSSGATSSTGRRRRRRSAPRRPGPSRRCEADGPRPIGGRTPLRCSLWSDARIGDNPSADPCFPQNVIDALNAIQAGLGEVPVPVLARDPARRADPALARVPVLRRAGPEGAPARPATSRCTGSASAAAPPTRCPAHIAMPAGWTTQRRRARCSSSRGMSSIVVDGVPVVRELAPLDRPLVAVGPGHEPFQAVPAASVVAAAPDRPGAATEPLPLSQRWSVPRERGRGARRRRHVAGAAAAGRRSSNRPREGSRSAGTRRRRTRAPEGSNGERSPGRRPGRAAHDHRR